MNLLFPLIPSLRAPLICTAISLGAFAAMFLPAHPARGETYAFTPFAGSPGNAGYVDAVGGTARFFAPVGIAIDARGNLFVTDGFDSYGGDRSAPGSAIRRITPDGSVTTVAGAFTSVGSADGTGREARFMGPSGVAIDANGNLFVADGAFGGSVRKITPGGTVTTLARGQGDFIGPYGVAVDVAGNVFITLLNAIRKITAGGVVTTFAGDEKNSSGSVDGAGGVARFAGPSGLAMDSGGNLFVGDHFNHTIRKITPSGVVTTIAGLAGVSGNADGVGSTARFAFPDGVAVDGDGNVFVTDLNGVRKISDDGFVTTLARTSDRGDAGGIGYPIGLAVSRTGEIYVADANCTIRKGVPFTGVLPALATQPQSYAAVRGRIAVFNVTASGSPAPSYQWTKDGRSLAGATEATLLLNNVTAVNAGTYQCIVTNAGGSATSYGAVLDVVDSIDAGHFGNFSVQASVGGGRSITAGLVVDGPGQKTVLIRGIGPGLAQFGVRGALADPAVAVINSSGERLAANGNWPATLAGVFTSVGAFALPVGSKDAAVLLPLQPGAYSVVLSDADGTGGEALIEIYEIP